ncbi:nucleoside triphosphate pyrophosphohydrolase [Micromonospora carbonacea]|uniref:Predicted house-cleaning noncanonical NTP pyrophosphatase, all-alpha NTP-PPase (MazG) superfamily n=1 Tax=Micromonospora carbonacea TaxID=47853 RepID=A0A1C5AAV3_9ACTN|nr:nucleoside triphosphate pyrophosphohydrolase [Micromonospora carbonacea]SCF42353.1 Predicted house-cleaning noncanonical NTP pyrophosphatase, all-alpha NTP-PPase (MazG) superfamily [Micromonospora carbonacea]
MADLATRTTCHGKLVRDLIPDIITARGGRPATVTLTGSAYLAALVAKLHEETDELASASPAERLGELADLHEVVAALTVELGYTAEQVREAAAVKRAERGGFDRRVWLGWVDHD